MPSSVDVSSLRGNRLLALLDDDTLRALAPDFHPVRLAVPEVLMREARPVRHAWFPAEGVLSMLAAVEGAQRKIEIGTVGNEGMAGLPLFLGAAHAHGTCFVQVPGHGWRMAAADFRRAVEHHPALDGVLRRYAHALMVQISQSTACNRVHTPLQRCARWLLMTGDRVPGDSFHMTQEFLAHMLGERRPTVSRVASELRERGFIDYKRGHITLLRRARLEEAACPCYGVVREAYAAISH